MVTCLEKTEENAEFHQIVEFLSTCSINYALTVSPTIYASYIEQFWNTAISKIVNSVKQIHVIVDGKDVVISESSVGSDLLFNDEDGIAFLTNAKFFENLALMGYEQISTKLTLQKGSFSPQWKFLIHTILHCMSSKSTAWNEFLTNLASAVICLAKGQKFNFSKLIFDGTLKNLDSKKILMYPRFLQLFLNNQLKDLPKPFNDTYETPKHSKKVFSNMARKRINFSGKVTPLFDSMLVQNQAPEGKCSAIPTEPQPTPSTSQPNILATQTAPLQTATHPTVSYELQIEAHIKSSDPPLSTSHTVKSGEDRMEQETDLTDFVPPTPYDSPLSGGHTPGSDEGMVETSTNKILGEDASKQGRSDDQTEELNLTNGADTKVIIEDKGSGEKGGSTTETVSTVRPDISAARPEVSIAKPKIPPTTTTLFDDEDVTIVDTLVKMKSQKAKEKGVAFKDADDSARPIRSITTFQPLLTIDPKDKGKSVLVEEEPTKLQKVKRRDKGLAQIERDKSSKKQKMMQEQESTKSDEEESTDYEQENKEFRMWLTVVSDKEETVDQDILSTKYPIVDWESQILENVDIEDKHVYKIIRANGNTSYQKSLSSMLRKFDGQDLVDLHRLVMKRFKDNTPEGYNLLLWGDLKKRIMSNQHMYRSLGER
nr:hypothetical protein [Tanacetum cinerariifolium]